MLVQHVSTKQLAYKYTYIKIMLSSYPSILREETKTIKNNEFENSNSCYTHLSTLCTIGQYIGLRSPEI